jgi:hypothetical protein
VVKEYPVYRMAWAVGGRGAFWTLFQHIKRNDIAMTAPVEMTMEVEGDDMREVDMAFLYESTDLGDLGRQGAVEVRDRDAATVLSIGLNGPLTPAKTRAAREAVDARLADLPDWASSGEWRLLGYNSPMVPASKRFYEIQVRVDRTDR